MKNNFFLLGLFFLLLSSLTFTACDDDDNIIEDDQDIIDYLENTADFSMLVTALDRADLKDNLDDDNATLTLFAPTNAAFQTFLTDNGFSDLDDVPNDVLEMVLMYHVLSDELASSELQTGYYMTMAEYDDNDDENLSLYVSTSGGVKINASADVTNADRMLRNGIIHTIDEVLDLPNIVTFATADPNFSSLVSALTRTDLSADFVTTLMGDGPFTVFAPTNAAFNALLASNSNWNSINDIPAATLEQVLSYHVISGANVRAEDLTDGQSVNTLAGSTVTIDLKSSTPKVVGGGSTANVIATNVQGTNGVVHAIDMVLLPE